MVLGRRPPRIMADSGTPSGFCHSGSITGHCDAETVNRELGCAPFAPDSGVQSLPCQSTPRDGGGPRPSHQTSFCGVNRTFVKSVFRAMVAIAFGFDFA